MLGQITCDTEIGDILSVQEVEQYLENIKVKINYYCDELSTMIKNEAQSGGLSYDAFYIDKRPLLNEEAGKILSMSEAVLEEFKSYKSKVLEKARTQRREELSKLKQEISKKLSSLRSQISSLRSRSNLSAASELETERIISETLRLTKEYEKYERKKEKVSTLLGEIL